MSVLSHPKYRPDIDGLRAIAVLSVVAFHAFPVWLKGGFIGVDIFFVISGFLISTIIFENLDKGSFSFSEFYARRIRRIFPALLLVLLVSLVFGWFALFSDEYKQLGKHVAAGAGFVSNFILWNERGYFDNASETKPLLHLWSLGIEEQFYIVWPFLLWTLRKTKLNLLLIIIVISAVSFLLNVVSVKGDTVAAFYSPQTRFWEFLVGAVLAYISVQKTGLARENHIDVWPDKFIRKNSSLNGHKLCNLLSCLGGAMLGASLALVTNSSYFPGWLALLPTLGTAFIIAAGSDAWVNRLILSNRFLVFVGLISFPLYLWHWPILSFAHIVESKMPRRGIRITAVVLSMILAWLTYRFIEKPIRFGTCGRSIVFAMMISMVIVGCAGYEIWLREGLPFRDPATREYTAQTAYADFSDGCSLKTTDIDHCADLPKPGAPIVLFVGDSLATQAYEIFKDQLSKNYDLVAFSNSGCPFLLDVNGYLELEGFGLRYCAVKTHEVMEFIRNHRQKIKAIIMAGQYDAYVTPGRLRDSNDNNKDVSFQSALNNTLLQFDGIKKIFIEQVPPLLFDPKSCLMRPFRITKKRECESNYQDVMSKLGPSRDMTREVLSTKPDVTLINMDSALCLEDKCVAAFNNRVLYYDKKHLNPFGVEFIKSKLEHSNTIPNLLEIIQKDDQHIPSP